MGKVSATTELARILGATTRPMSPAEILATSAPSVSKTAIYAALSMGTSNGVYRRYGSRGDYRYELAKKRPAVQPQPASPESERRVPMLPEQLSPSIGLTCAHARSLSEGERRLVLAIEASFRSTPEQTLEQLVESLAGLGDRTAVKTALQEYAFAGQLTSRKEGSLTLYYLVDAAAERMDEEEETVEASDEPASERPADSLSFARRLQAVCDDLSQAIEDACDSAAPHAVIKHLVAANRAAQFARLGLQG